jgi:DUF1016 N-terminal domain
MTRQPISPSTQKSFAIVVQMIQAARKTAAQAVNTQLIDLYWQVGAYISQKLEKAEWGDGVVTQLAEYLAKYSARIARI